MPLPLGDSVWVKLRMKMYMMATVYVLLGETLHHHETIKRGVVTCRVTQKYPLHTKDRKVKDFLTGHT